MTTIKVQAAPGLRVPMAHHPHEYIGDDVPVDVDGDDMYYRRLLADGDLLLAEAPGEPLKTEKPAAKGKGA
ncbi:DUF2635 domain-containing protein [Kingella denitrificans]|uniref:DUF2635 domain-containing protein n=1 Tax=Kingella denitrificans TaxID=502 RepID=UPI00288C0F9F|nr:DUF2635 domain-containing protein [Kingella denitrificans]